MKFVSIVFAIAFLWLAGLLPVSSQEAKPAAPLSLQECLDIALKNQVDIQVGLNDVDAARYRLTQARSDYFPQVSIVNNAFTVGSNGVLTERNTGTAVAVTENIYDGGIRETRVSGARYNVTGSQAGFSRTVQSVVFSVTTSYYEVLRAKHLADVAQSNVKYNESLKQLIQARIDVGSAAQVDVLQVDVQLATAQVDLISAKNQIRVALTQLQNAMGLSQQPAFDIQDVTGQPDPSIQPLDTYVTKAVASRPDVLQAKAGVGAANASVKSSRIALYPRPVITGAYEKGVGGLEGESGQIFGGIVFDVFNGGNNRAAYKEAVANRKTAEQIDQQVVKNIQADVQTAYLNLNDAKERLTASAISLTAAQKNYDVQQEKYKQGLAIILDVLSAELQVVTAQTNVVEARYDLYTAMAQMDFAIGKAGGFNAN